MTHPTSMNVPAGRGPRLAGCLIATLALMPLPEVSQLDSGGASLRGLPGLAVMVERTTSEARRYGVSEEWLEARLSGALREAGLPRIERSDALSSDRMPLLVVRLQTVRVPGRQALAWHLSLGVHQRMGTLAARPDTTLTVSWAASTALGITSGSLLRESIQESLERQAEELGRVWRNRPGGR